jgi:hypothetical protein
MPFSSPIRSCESEVGVGSGESESLIRLSHFLLPISNFRSYAAFFWSAAAIASPFLMASSIPPTM